jgi:hypothetical protein
MPMKAQGVAQVLLKDRRLQRDGAGIHWTWQLQ